MERLSDQIKIIEQAGGEAKILTRLSFQTFFLVFIPCCLTIYSQNRLIETPCHKEGQVLVLVSEFDTRKKLRGRVVQDSKEGSHGSLLQGHSYEKSQTKEGWTQAMARQMAEWKRSLTILVPAACPSLCVLGRSSLSLDLQSFICTVRGWSEAFPVLAFERLRIHVIKNDDKERRKE